jgi:S-adenosylmethionine decarboxylase
LHALGTHLLLELRECNPKTLKNLEFVQETLKNAALEAKATIVEVAFHEFSPFGISGMVVIAESHLAIHTWPEYGYAAVDVFTCGDLIDPRVAANFLIEKFESKNPAIIEMKRGILGMGNLPHKATLQGEPHQHDRAQELQVVH